MCNVDEIIAEQLNEIIMLIKVSLWLPTSTNMLTLRTPG
jgi:hypothetical protein